MKTGFMFAIPYALAIFPFIYKQSGSLTAAFVVTTLGFVPVFLYGRQQSTAIYALISKPTRQSFLDALLGSRSAKNRNSEPN